MNSIQSVYYKVGNEDERSLVVCLSGRKGKVWSRGIAIYSPTDTFGKLGYSIAKIRARKALAIYEESFSTGFQVMADKVAPKNLLDFIDQPMKVFEREHGRETQFCQIERNFKSVCPASLTGYEKKILAPLLKNEKKGQKKPKKMALDKMCLGCGHSQFEEGGKFNRGKCSMWESDPCVNFLTEV
jgi:hypothetical protein